MSTDKPQRASPKTWGILALVAVGIVAFFLWSGPWLWEVFRDPQAFRDWLKQFGPLSPLIFVFLQALQVVVFAIPGEVTQIAAGWMFGFYLGSALSVAGILVGSSISFGLARGLGIRFVHKIAGPQAVSRFDHLMASPKFIGSLFLFFLIPGIPKDILCYVAGLSRLKFLPFLAISTLARLPGILGSSLMGKAVFEGNWVLLASVAGGALVLFGLGWWFREPIFRFVERFAIDNPSSKDQPS